jgi:hypothetical protein
MTTTDQYWHSGPDKPKGCWFESNRGSFTRGLILWRSFYPELPHRAPAAGAASGAASLGRVAKVYQCAGSSQ